VAATRLLARPGWSQSLRGRLAAGAAGPIRHRVAAGPLPAAAGRRCPFPAQLPEPPWGRRLAARPGQRSGDRTAPRNTPVPHVVQPEGRRRARLPVSDDLPRRQARTQRVSLEMAEGQVVIAIVPSEHGSIVPLRAPVCDQGRLCRGASGTRGRPARQVGRFKGSTDVLSAAGRAARSPGRGPRKLTRVVHRARPVQGRQGLAPGLQRDRAPARMPDPLRLIRRESG
jgi:hypothetical protein